MSAQERSRGNGMADHRVKTGLLAQPPQGLARVFPLRAGAYWRDGVRFETQTGASRARHNGM